MITVLKVEICICSFVVLTVTFVFIHNFLAYYMKYEYCAVCISALVVAVSLFIIK